MFIGKFFAGLVLAIFIFNVIFSPSAFAMYSGMKPIIIIDHPKQEKYHRAETPIDEIVIFDHKNCIADNEFDRHAILEALTLNPRTREATSKYLDIAEMAEKLERELAYTNHQLAEAKAALCEAVDSEVEDIINDTRIKLNRLYGRVRELSRLLDKAEKSAFTAWNAILKRQR